MGVLGDLPDAITTRLKSQIRSPLDISGMRYSGYKYNHGPFYMPKSKASVRKIDPGPAAKTALRRWRLACPPNELDLVLPSEHGLPLNHSSMLRVYFHPALTRAEFPRIRFHDLRHTYASLLIDQGETVVYIQKRLGHSQPTETLNICSHLVEKHRP
jgi:integrase